MSFLTKIRYLAIEVVSMNTAPTPMWFSHMSHQKFTAWWPKLLLWGTELTLYHIMGSVSWAWILIFHYGWWLQLNIKWKTFLSSFANCLWQTLKAFPFMKFPRGILTFFWTVHCKWWASKDEAFSEKTSGYLFCREFHALQMYFCRLPRNFQLCPTQFVKLRFSYIFREFSTLSRSAEHFFLKILLKNYLCAKNDYGFLCHLWRLDYKSHNRNVQVLTEERHL